ncbi:MAG: hypothetical protein V1881_00760, partial [Candidatus Micrarchaeota archaeon]
AYLTPSCFASPGNYDFTLRGQSSDYTANAHVALRVTPCVTLQDVSTDSKTMCLGEKHTYKVLLRNKSRTAAKNYTIILTGDAAPAASAAQKVYVPAVGETTFDISLDSAKLSGTGTKTLNVRAVSIYEVTGQPTNDEGTLTMQFVMNNCQTLDFNFPNLNGNVIEKCAETPFSTPMVVTNAGPLSDTVTLYTNASQATLPRTLQLASGGTQQAQLTIGQTAIGSFTLKVSAASKYGAVREKNLEVVSKTCFGVDVNAFLPNNTCSDTEHAFPVKIKNTGAAPQLFNLSVKNMDFVALQPAQVFLNPGEEKEVKLLVSSGMKDGKYEPIVSARSEMSYGENKSYIYLERCYGVRLSGENDWICQCSDKAFPFNVMNIGTQSDSYTLSRIDGPDWIQQDLLNGTVMSIEGKSRRTVNPVAFTCDADPLRYQFTFAVTSLSRNASDKLCVNITVYSKAVCYVARIGGPDAEVVECTSTIIPVTIQNTGMVKNAYALDVEGPVWANVTPDFVLLEKGESQVVYLSASPPLNEAGKTYTVKIIATSKGVVSTKEITLNVVPVGSKSSPTPKLEVMPLDISYAAGNLHFKCADGALVSIKSPSNKTSAATCVNGTATLGAGEYGVYSVAVTKSGFVPITTTYEAKAPSSQSGMFLASTTALWIAGALLVALVAYGVYSVMQKKRK